MTNDNIDPALKELGQYVVGQLRILQSRINALEVIVQQLAIEGAARADDPQAWLTRFSDILRKARGVYDGDAAEAQQQMKLIETNMEKFLADLARSAKSLK